MNIKFLFTVFFYISLFLTLIVSTTARHIALKDKPRSQKAGRAAVILSFISLVFLALKFLVK